MMIQPAPAPAGHEDGRVTPSVWGLSALALHDAYWRSYGVHCLRAGSGATPDRSADLFLLLGPHELVRFDVRELSQHLLWVDAAVTRLRIVEHKPESYRERIQADEHGLVERIERIYRPQTRALCRVVLTRRARLARAWVHATSARAAWRRVHHLVGPRQVDYWQCDGRCFDAASPADERRFVDDLVAAWDRPDRAIAGLTEVVPGVWCMPGETIPSTTRLVGPLWIGRHAQLATDECLVGPHVLPDTPDAEGGDANGLEASLRQIGQIEPGDTPVDRRPTASAPGYAIAKRTFDLAASLVGLLLLSPVIAAIAMAIILDDGRPVFFGHVRQTRGGRLFRCWKFRTMRRGADRLARELQAQNACDGPQFYIEHDPRVTRLGQLLRKYHLDELPQLWNVLRGHMSLVGPRPSPDRENQICAPWRDIRLSVRPGITGLWQIKRTRKPGLDFQEWIRYDVEYVRTAGFWTDLAIILTTLRNLLSRLLRVS